MKMISLLVVAVAVFSASAASADGSPWLPIPKSGALSLSYVSEDAETFYRGEENRDLPFGGLEQQSIYLNANYGLTDSIALDVQAVHTSVSGDAPSPPGPPDEDGWADIRVGATWRFVDEYVNPAAPSVALRVGYTVAGDYTSTLPTAIGDGADALEASLVFGKIFDNRFALSVEWGYRSRSDDVPNESFINAKAFVLVGERWILNAQIHKTTASGNLDIGGQGFTPARFAETSEDIERFGLGAEFNVTPDIGLGLNWFKVTDGRNTAEFDTIAATVSYKFDLYGAG
ncbi:MAG: hypothetical protein OXF31_09225 [Gammaproteobacteria bacterium]|nr:hypothetical protein [Gammaproteobacteria bacterium]